MIDGQCEERSFYRIKVFVKLHDFLCRFRITEIQSSVTELFFLNATLNCHIDCRAKIESVQYGRNYYRIKKMYTQCGNNERISLYNNENIISRKFGLNLKIGANIP